MLRLRECSQQQLDTVPLLLNGAVAQVTLAQQQHEFTSQLRELQVGIRSPEANLPKNISDTPGMSVPKTGWMSIIRTLHQLHNRDVLRHAKGTKPRRLHGHELSYVTCSRGGACYTFPACTCVTMTLYKIFVTCQRKLLKFNFSS